jgi:hypothetical protein
MNDKKSKAGRPKVAKNKLRTTKTMRVPIELIELMKQITDGYRRGVITIDDVRELAGKGLENVK